MLFFDTSDYARQLQKAGFTEHQAEVQMDVLRTLIENDLATKQDIASLPRCNRLVAQGDSRKH